jgi:hypothetical protein
VTPPGGSRSPDLIAALDQLQAALTDVARVLAGYRRMLILAGFGLDEALELCLAVQREIILDHLAED